MNATMTIETAALKHASHLETVSPGLPASFNDANVVGDTIAQGDLYISIVGEWPSDHVQVRNPTEKDRQLVPETGAGSHHRLASLVGVQIRRRADWSVDRDTDDLDGPSLTVDVPTEIVHDPGHAHPHGTVTLVPGFVYHCCYQRTLIGEQRKEARARD